MGGKRRTGAVRIAPLSRGELDAACAVLAEACAFDDAAAVAEEKLFEVGAGGAAAHAFGAWRGGALVGVAAVSARWLRLIAVAPGARGAGVGSALLAACARGRDGVLTALGQPGNYLAPGVDERNVEALAWLARRGFEPDGVNVSLEIDVARNERASAARAAELAEAAARDGYELRRATPSEPAGLVDWVDRTFSAGWAYEVGRAVARPPGAVHVAVRDGELAAFAAHDGNNTGLGWFGPTGTAEDHRGRGLGAALLLACLRDVADAGHAQCVVSWIGPRAFYDWCVGIAGERRYVVMRKRL